MADSPTIRSINETHTSRPSFSPLSINEPPPVTDRPPPGVPEHPVGGPPPEKTVHGAVDPDELEDEIEQAEEDGEFTAMHRTSKTKR